MAGAFYDSAAVTQRPLDAARDLFERRRLIGLLTQCRVTLRYKRSLLGVGWTLMSPILEMGVLLLVFSHVFRFVSPDAPYVVYLLSGIVLVTLANTTILAVGGALVENAAVLSRLRVPPEVFCLAAAGDTVLRFSLSLVPLAVIILATGTTIAATAPLALAAALLLGLTAFGLGLALAPVAVRFSDTMIVVGPLITLVTFLAPVFYPLSIVPHRYQIVIELNPLLHFLNVFRSTLYSGSLGSATDWAVVLAAPVLAVLLGLLVIRRTMSAAILHL